MYNPKKVIELIESSGVKNKELLDFMGKNWNGSVDAVIKGDIRVSKLEKIADFFGVPVDAFFDREVTAGGVNVGGVRNKVHHFSIANGDPDVKNLQSLIEEKDKRIKLLEEMVELLKRNQPGV